MKVLGIDPGVVNIGYANIINGFPINFGTEYIKGDHSLLLASVSCVNTLIRINRPDMVIIEGGFGSNLTVRCIGAMEYYLDYNSIPYQEVPSKSIKKRIIGNGNANKEDVINFINDQFNIGLVYKGKKDHKNDQHIADAILIAIYGETINV